MAAQIDFKKSVIDFELFEDSDIICVISEILKNFVDNIIVPKTEDPCFGRLELAS